jgi:hypothetical protein
MAWFKGPIGPTRGFKEVKTRSVLKELKRKHAQGAEDTKRAQGAEAEACARS